MAKCHAVSIFNQWALDGQVHLPQYNLQKLANALFPAPSPELGLIIHFDPVHDIDEIAVLTRNSNYRNLICNTIYVPVNRMALKNSRHHVLATVCSNVADQAAPLVPTPPSPAIQEQTTMQNTVFGRPESPLTDMEEEEWPQYIHTRASRLQKVAVLMKGSTSKVRIAAAIRAYTVLTTLSAGLWCP